MADYNIQMKKYVQSTNSYDNLNPKPMSHASTHASNGSDPITPANIGAIPTSAKGANNGVASLGSDGKVPTSQLPALGSASVKAVTIPASGWSAGADGRFTQVVPVTDMGINSSTKIVIVDCNLGTSDISAKLAILEAWAGPSANEVIQQTNALVFYSGFKPAVNIPISVGVVN